MLRVAPKGEVALATSLPLGEDRILRAAFGRFGGQPKGREAAVPVVRHYQQLGSGSWFLCDCRPGAERPPALVPVAETHIRRHQDQRWPVHSDACDFQREPAEQRAIVDSFSAAAAHRALRLVRPIGTVSPAMVPGEVGQSRNVRRPGIARLLARLMTDAGLQSVGPDWVPPQVVDQVKAIWTAALGRDRRWRSATRVPLHQSGEAGRGAGQDRGCAGWPLPPVPSAWRVAHEGRGCRRRCFADAWRRRHPCPRPDCCVWGAAERRAWTRRQSAPHVRHTLLLASSGGAAPDAPPEVLSAYLHPCVSQQHLMLVDSDLERQTFAQLRSVQTWLGKRNLARVSIEKPLFDIWSEDQGKAEVAPRPPCLPDFITRASGADGAAKAAIIETMGFADPDYRERNKRSHALMSLAVGGAPVIMHDFREPAGRLPPDRDREFWRAVRWQLSDAQHSPPDRGTGRRQRAVEQSHPG